MAQDKGFFDTIKFVLVADELIHLFLSLEQVLVVFLLHLLLLHHTGSTRHQLHFLETLLVLKKETHNALKSIDQEEGPRH